MWRVRACFHRSSCNDLLIVMYGTPVCVIQVKRGIIRHTGVNRDRAFTMVELSSHILATSELPDHGDEIMCVACG